MTIGTLSAHADNLKLIHATARTLVVGCTVLCLCEGEEARKNPVIRNQSYEEFVEPDEDNDE